MTAIATPIATPIQATARPVRVQVGLHQERPCPGAVAYQALAALTTTTSYRNPRIDRGGDPVRAKRTVALALAEAARQTAADAAHIRLLESLAPLLAIGPAGLGLAADLVRQGATPDLHQALVWTDGVHARLLFRGDLRIIQVRGGTASLIRPMQPQGVGHCELALEAGDTLVLVAPVTHAQLPLGTVAAMAREEQTPQALCQRATAQAAAYDPMSHHAAVALSLA